MTRDFDIRKALRQELTRLHSSEPDTLVVEELGLCQGFARVDLAVVNGSLHGYEIKSDRDTLGRLPAQAEIYSRSLEFVTVVASPTHLIEMRKLIPKWWGIWTAKDCKGVVSLKQRRKARPNPNVCRLALAQLLWRKEALNILTSRNLATGLKSKARQELWLRLSTELPLEELSNVVRTNLKDRGGSWRAPVSQL